MLMSCSADRMLTVSNHMGDTTYDSYVIKKGDTSHLKWNPFSTPGSVNHGVMGCLIAREKLFLFNPATQEHRFIEFAKAGMSKPICFDWLANDKVFVGF